MTAPRIVDNAAGANGTRPAPRPVRSPAADATQPTADVSQLLTATGQLPSPPTEFDAAAATTLLTELNWIRDERYTVEPAAAALVLEICNYRNRPVSRDYLNQLAAKMKTGRWAYNGAAIKFAETGRLLDGQSRLGACVLSGKPFDTKIVLGLSESVVDTIDTGRAQGRAAKLARAGYAKATHLTAAVILVDGYERQILTASGVKTPNAIPTEKIVAFVEQRPELLESLRYMAKVRSHLHGWLATSVFTASHYLATVRGLPLDFFDKLVKLDNLAVDSGPLKLHKTLSTLNRHGRMVGSGMQLALLMKAYRAWIDKRGLRTLGWRENEEFPYLI